MDHVVYVLHVVIIADRRSEKKPRMLADKLNWILVVLQHEKCNINSKDVKEKLETRIGREKGKGGRLPPMSCSSTSVTLRRWCWTKKKSAAVVLAEGGYCVFTLCFFFQRLKTNEKNDSCSSWQVEMNAWYLYWLTERRTQLLRDFWMTGAEEQLYIFSVTNDFEKQVEL